MTARVIDADIAIIGGGLAGACMASLLVEAASSKNGLSPDKILLIEPRLPPSAMSDAPAVNRDEKRAADGSALDDVDLRVSAISRASERILGVCGVWEQLRAGRIGAYERMCVWDENGKAEGPGAVHFDCARLAQPNLGYILENRLMQDALLAQARRAGVKLLPTEVAALRVDGEAMQLELRDGTQLRVGLVIAGDGAASPTRQMMGIATRGARYAQRAVVTHVRTSEMHRETAWQRFLSTGPIALLPLPDGRSSIVWSTDETAAQALIANTEAEFCKAVERAVDGVLGTVEGCSARAAFPLQHAHAERYTAERFVLIGDAAHTVHPLAGQGVNLGFLDCAALAQTIVEALEQGADAGEARVLRRYERWRKGENLAMLAALDGLNALFSNNSGTLGAVRRIGLTAIDRAEPVKMAFMRRALGLVGDLPRIALMEQPARQ